jgi:hypothetical protein
MNEQKENVKVIKNSGFKGHFLDLVKQKGA